MEEKPARKRNRPKRLQTHFSATPELVQAIDRSARASGLSRSSWIRHVLTLATAESQPNETASAAV